MKELPESKTSTSISDKAFGPLTGIDIGHGYRLVNSMADVYDDDCLVTRPEPASFCRFQPSWKSTLNSESFGSLARAWLVCLVFAA